MIVKLLIFGLVSSILTQECLSYSVYSVTFPSEDYPVESTPSPDNEVTNEEDNTIYTHSIACPKRTEEGLVGFAGVTGSETTTDKKTLPTTTETKAEGGKTELPCEKKLKWYRDTTMKTQELFDKYYGEYKKINHHDNKTAEIEAEHSEFKQHVDTALERFQTDAKKIYNISDDSARVAFCVSEMKWFQVMDANLTKVAKNIKTDLLNVLDAVGVSKETKDNFDKILSRIVNFLFIIDLTKNLLKDVKSLTDQALKVTDEGIKLEDRYQVVEGGVEESAAAIDYDNAINSNPDDKELQNELNDLQDDKKITEGETHLEELEKGQEGKPGEIDEGEPEFEPIEDEIPIIDI